MTTLGLTGNESFDVLGLNELSRPRDAVTLVIHRANGKQESVALTLRLDTPAEIAYVKRGGILPYVLEGMAA